MQTLDTTFGKFQLQRLPLPSKGQKENLRAWDAADELILHHLHQHHLISDLTKPILIINDAFGALSISLHQSKLHSWSDSYVSHLATQHNFSLNHINGDKTFTAIASTQKLETHYDLVLIKTPKTLALLEHQLCQLKPYINENTTLIAAGMVKHIHTSTLKYFEKIIGNTTTSLATKKARLIFASNDKTDNIVSPYPTYFSDKQLDIKLSNHANVFSRDHLDIGARFFIQQLNQCPKASNVIDLGCGNGVLGIMLKRQQTGAHISFVDESYMAIESAKINYSNNISSDDQAAEFYVGDCINQFKGEKLDLILCNPPFHQAHSVGDHIAWQMFKQSRGHLNPKGELWVVANRHLAYHVKLKRLFGNCRTIASNKKFVVLAARKRK